MGIIVVFFGSLIGMLLLLVFSSWEVKRGGRVGGEIRVRLDRAVSDGVLFLKVHIPEAGKSVARSSMRTLLIMVGSHALRCIRKVEARLSLFLRTGLKRDPEAEKRFLNGTEKKF
jgi:hypothetical protein